MSLIRKKKKILVITLGYPHPQKGASSVLFYWYLEALNKANFKVKHLLFVSPEEYSKQAEYDYVKAISPNDDFDISVLPVKGIRQVRRSKLMLHICNLPDEIYSNIESFKPDAVICFDIIAVAIARHMNLDQPLIWLGDLSFKTIIYHAYYDFKLERYKIFGLARAYFGSLLWKRFYRNLLREEHNVIVSSHSSVGHLAQLGVSSQYWPYPWPSAEISEDIIIKKYKKPTFILFGTLVALGSRSALYFLLKSVCPLLLRIWGVQGFSILIAGMHELPEWAKIEIEQHKEFKFLGFVNDLAMEVTRCHAVLAPISVPVGNRSRILTAMSMGALVIAHSNTALGNPELISGENCLLATSADGFVEHMQFAYDYPTVATKLGAMAKETYNKSFEPIIASDRLVQALESKLLR